MASDVGTMTCPCSGFGSATAASDVGLVAFCSAFDFLMTIAFDDGDTDLFSSAVDTTTNAFDVGRLVSS